MSLCYDIYDCGCIEALRLTLTILKQLDAIMHNKYAGNPEKLAAWLTASNIQRPSANGKQPAPSPTPAPQTAAKA